MITAKSRRLVRKITCVCSVGLVSASCFAGPQDAIRIFAHGEHVAAGIAFVYRVENQGTGKVTSFAIGTGGVNGYELDVPPVGWGTVYDDTEWANPMVPPSTVASPAGWEGYPSGPFHRGDEKSEAEIDRRLSFVWTVTDPEGAQAAAIPPGQTLTGFRLLVPRFDSAYVEGKYSASSNDGKGAGSLLEKADAQTPTLTVRASPSAVTKASGTSLKVQAILTVTDDYDPKPELKLESITASVPMNQSEIKGAVFGTDDRLFILPVKKDPTGKPVVYTVTYSATDGTGNKATSSATVTLNP